MDSHRINCVRVFKGYDSDVAREKTVDYITKMYAVSIREMRGTKPHQQLKELSAEERYAHTHTHFFFCHHNESGSVIWDGCIKNMPEYWLGKI